MATAQKQNHLKTCYDACEEDGDIFETNQQNIWFLGKDEKAVPPGARPLAPLSRMLANPSFALGQNRGFHKRRLICVPFFSLR